MNDFTKDELEYIRNYIFNGAACISVKNHEALRDKIQSLIDSYCEHPILEGNVTGYKCMGCQEMFNDSQ